MTSPCYGIQHDLEALVTTHLFVLCPNNSGSTLLRNALRTSRHTWNLGHEGQRAYGFVGPRLRKDNRQLVWAARPEWARAYADPANFDWELTRRAWYAQATAQAATASVMVEKSPPFLLVADQLAASFRNARFAVMVRNPYATYEGIIRRRIPRPPGDPEDPRVLAARHVAACLEHQRRNLARLGDAATFFTYEQLCAAPGDCAAQLERLVPELDDVDLTGPIEVKGMYHEPLRDMNADQIGRLPPGDMALATAVFAESEAVLAHFGYELQ